jgi:hypothetical protein
MAIMVPALRKAREQAKTVICGTRLHNIALSFSVYSEDYKTVPLAWNRNKVESWHNLLLKLNYLNIESLTCPAVKLDETRLWPKPKKDSSYYMGHYGMNYYIGGTYGNYGGSEIVDRKPLKLHEKTRGVILVGDIRESCDQVGYAYMEKSYFSDVSFKDRYAERHGAKGAELDYNHGLPSRSSNIGRSWRTGGSSNYMFADLHLENSNNWQDYIDDSYWEGSN